MKKENNEDSKNQLKKTSFRNTFLQKVKLFISLTFDLMYNDK